jgi:hypothetical protein
MYAIVTPRHSALQTLVKVLPVTPHAGLSKSLHSRHDAGAVPE